jgi:hypothetical protein
MYGLVNQAIQEMVIQAYGQETWEKLATNAGTDTDFITMDVYPDEDSVKLVGSACQMLNAAPADVLKGFGEFWVNFAKEKYGDIYEMSGSHFVQFVENLNNLHVRVAQMMPELKPPTFKVTDKTEDSFVLHYYTHRSGLQPALVGMLLGLGKQFNTQVEVSVIKDRDGGHDHDELLVKYRPA